MADNSLNSLSVKPYLSINDKADLLDRILHEHKILLTIVKGYPDVLNEYIVAVKGPCTDPAREPTALVLKNLRIVQEAEKLRNDFQH